MRRSRARPFRRCAVLGRAANGAGAIGLNGEQLLEGGIYEVDEDLARELIVANRATEIDERVVQPKEES